MNIIILAQPVFAFIAWLIVLVFAKPQRIKELWPCGLLGAVIIFSTWQMLLTLQLAWFVDGFLPIAGVPVFNIIWGAAAGIFVANLLPGDFGGKVMAAFLSTLLAAAFGYVSENITRDHVHSTAYTDVHNFILDFVVLSVFIWFAEGLFYNRIHPDDSIRNQSAH